MPLYRCVYRNAMGKKHRELLSALSRDRLQNRLISQGLFPISLREIPERNKGGNKMGINDARIFAEGLSMLLSGGHTLKDAIPLMRHLNNSRVFREAVDEIANELGKGKSFHQTLEESKIQFPKGFSNLAAIGEQSGALLSVMMHLASYYKRIRNLRSKLGTSLIYPSLVLLVALVAGVFLALYVQPKIIAIFQDISPESLENMNKTGLKLPFIFIITIILATLVTLRLAFRQWWKSHTGLLWLKIPFLGKFLIDWNLMNWSFAMELLSSQQLVLDRCLCEASHAVSNPFLKSKCLDLANAVSRGEYLSEAIRKESLFLPILSQWILIGENTGKSEAAFMNIRAYFEDRVSRSIDIATQLTEPLIILLIGGVIIYAVLRFVVPLFQLMGGIL